MTINHFQMASDGRLSAEARQTSASCILSKTTASSITLRIAMGADKEAIWNRVGDQSSWNQLTKSDTWWRAAPDHNYAFSDSTWLFYLHLWLSVNSALGCIDSFKLLQEAAPHLQKPPLTSDETGAVTLLDRTSPLCSKGIGTHIQCQRKVNSETCGVTLF